jgi:hypothetical protein
VQQPDRYDYLCAAGNNQLRGRVGFVDDAST